MENNSKLLSMLPDEQGPPGLGIVAPPISPTLLRTAPTSLFIQVNP
jgi:hypothetical protein